MPDPFSDGGHETGTDSAAINAALWELSAHGRHTVSVRDIAARAELGAGWPKANEHLNYWRNKGGCKGRLPSGQRFRPDRTGEGESAHWLLVEVTSSPEVTPPGLMSIRRPRDQSWPKVLAWLGNHLAQIIVGVIATVLGGWILTRLFAQ